MAGTDFKKLKAGGAYAMLNHDLRDNKNYSNKDIDVTKSCLNAQYFLKVAPDKESMIRRYRDRLAKVEETNTNNRKDRVEAFSLECKVPKGMSYDDAKAWMRECVLIMVGKYGAENYIGGVGHFDETHEYVDPETKETEISRPHLHAIFVAEHEGQLAGKWFSSRANMIDMNNRIQAMTEAKFPGYTYMTGQKRKSGGFKSVEQLKYESEIAELELSLENMRVKEAEWSSKVNNRRLEAESKQKQVDALKDEKEGLEDEISRLRDTETELMDSIAEKRQERSELDREIQALTRTKDEVLTTQQKQDLENKARELERAMQSLQGKGIEFER